mgnify:CR=1 FL=1
MNLGDFVKTKRYERGLSQRQLSAVSGVSNSEISRIESGERQNPAPSVLRALAAALQVTYEEMLSAAGYLSATSGQDAKLPEWIYNLPPDLYDFVREDASKDWTYIRMAKDFSRKALEPKELEALVRTWVQAKKGKRR